MNIELLAEKVHNAYLETCKKLGWSVKPENQVPYSELSEDSKKLDRASVRAVIMHAGQYVMEDDMPCCPDCHDYNQLVMFCCNCREIKHFE